MKHSDDEGTGAPPVPAYLDALVRPERRRLLERYAELLATDGVVRGLIGPREAPRLWDRHLVNCALLASAVGPAATVADIGSGAGLPGLVLAITRPDLSVTLIEPLLRRTTFLEEVVAELGLDNVTVLRGRADALHGKATYDVVTSRAVAPLDRLLEWSMPLVAPHGVLLAMKGSSVAEEIPGASSALKALGCADPVVVVWGATEALSASGEAGPPGIADQLDDAARSALDTVAPLHLARVAWRDPARVSLPGREPGSSKSNRPNARRRGSAPNKRRKS